MNNKHNSNEQLVFIDLNWILPVRGHCPVPVVMQGVLFIPQNLQRHQPSESSDRRSPNSTPTHLIAKALLSLHNQTASLWTHPWFCKYTDLLIAWQKCSWNGRKLHLDYIWIHLTSERTLVVGLEHLHSLDQSWHPHIMSASFPASLVFRGSQCWLTSVQFQVGTCIMHL